MSAADDELLDDVAGFVPSVLEITGKLALEHFRAELFAEDKGSIHGYDPVTVAEFVWLPTAVARAVIAIRTVCPGAIVPRTHVTSEGVAEQAPWLGLAVT